MKGRCSLALTAVLMATSKSSLATPSARLVYLRNPGAESCPDETAVRAAVAARLGYDPFFPNAAATMFIEIARDKNRYRARVKLVDAKNDVRGTREIAEPDSCAGMIDTLALSISIAIDPDRLTREPPGAKATESSSPASGSASGSEPPREAPERATEPAPPSRTAREAEPAREQDRSARPTTTRTSFWELWLAPAVWVNSGPPFALGGEVGARRRWSNLSLGLSARGDLPSSRSIAGLDVPLSFVGGTAAACGHLSVLSACALATLGQLSASSNAVNARADSTLRFLLGVSVGVELGATDAFRPFARAIVHGAVGSQSVVVSGLRAYDLPDLSAGFELGSAFRF